jgi:chromosome segregation ATPase
MEEDLKQCTEDLKNEKLTSHNIQASLTAAKQHIRDNDNAVRQLESTLDTLSHHSTDVKARVDRLERDKSAAEARVRELEVALRQAKASAVPSAIPVSRAPSRTGRRRSSSLAPPMSQELTEARTTLSKKEADLRVASDKLARAQNELNRCENEKAALEKRLGAQLRELQANMEEKNNEIEWLRAEQGDGEGGASAREAELVRRIEEDTAKMAALEMLVREQPEADSLKKALKRAEQMLKVEAQRVAEAEARHVDLVAEKEAALDELEAAQAHVRELTKMVEDDERRIHAITMNER